MPPRPPGRATGPEEREGQRMDASLFPEEELGRRLEGEGSPLPADFDGIHGRGVAGSIYNVKLQKPFASRAGEVDEPDFGLYSKSCHDFMLLEAVNRGS